MAISTVKERNELKPRHAPYWHKIKMGCFLGFRKITSDTSGAWLARYRLDDTGAQKLHSLGSFDESPPTERFDLAQAAARQWFTRMGQGGEAKEITVGEACKRYVQKQRDEGKDQAAKDLEVRFKRWMHSDARLSNTPLTKLTAGMVNDWRNKLAKAPAIPQDKTKASTKPRAASTTNREMAVFKAALNLAMRDGYVSSDHAWKYKLTPIKDATGRRDCYLDPSQRRELIKHAPDDLAAFLKAMSLIPLRPGAVAALTVGNFDKRLGVLTIGKDKAGKDRKITLPKATAAFFAEQSKKKLPSAPLVGRADGQFWNKDSWKYPFKDAVIAAKLPAAATAYALRHSTITDLIALHKLDTMTVAALSGTSLTMIEKHYGHLLRDHASNALALLAL